jgi:hypothetical protein
LSLGAQIEAWGLRLSLGAQIEAWGLRLSLGAQIEAWGLRLSLGARIEAWGLSGLLWAALGCSGLLWAVLGCSGVLWGALGCSGLFWAALGCSGLSCSETFFPIPTQCSPVVGVTRGGTFQVFPRSRSNTRGNKGHYFHCSPACYSDYGAAVGMFLRVLLRLRGNSW